MAEQNIPNQPSEWDEATRLIEAPEPTLVMSAQEHPSPFFMRQPEPTQVLPIQGAAWTAPQAAASPQAPDMAGLGPHPWDSSRLTTPTTVSWTRRVAAVVLAGAIFASGVALNGPLTSLARSVLPGRTPSVQQGQSTQPWLPGQSAGRPTQDQPVDPWGGSGEEAPSQAQRSSVSGQTTATAAQQTGVVLIQARTTNGTSAGSGMVLTSDGKVLTNYHVVQSSTSLKVTIASTRRSYSATVVGHDASRDVALLKLQDASGLATVKLDDDDDLAVGSNITAVGNSQGQGYLSAAPGKVTDLHASIAVASETSASGSEALTDVVQTTAKAVPGDSGGPMLDAEGEVVGMTTAGQQVSSRTRTTAVTVASFAVPIDTAMGVVRQIESGKSSGTVRVGRNAYLGVTVTSSRMGAVVVSQVVDGQAADRAGISRGDVLVAIDGVEIGSHADLAEVLAQHKPGEKVSVVVADGVGAQQQVEVTLGASPIN